MDLAKLLAASGQADSIAKLAGELGLDTSDAGRLVDAVAPALGSGIARQAASADGLKSLGKALATGGHERYLEQPELLSRPETREDGNRILGHLFGSKEVSREVAAQAAGQTGIDAGLIKKALPLLAGLAMGAVSRQSKQDTGAAGGSAGSLGALASLLGGNDSGSALSNMLGAARKLF